MMRTSALNVRWRYLAAPGVLAAAAATMAWSAPNDKPAPNQQPTTAVAKASDLPSEAVDLSDKLEVTVQGTLKSTSRTAHSVTILVKNASKEDLKGPIIVVIDRTGIDALKLDQPDGTLSDARPYVEIVNDKGELKAGKSLRAQKLLFQTAESISGEARRQFDLKVRVCRLDKELADANKKGDSDKIEGKSYSWKDFDKAAAIQEKWTIPLIQRGKQEVYGTAIGENDKGELQVNVYTQRSSTGDLLPETIDGLPVHVEVMGQMARARPARDSVVYSNGVPHTAQRGNAGNSKAVPDNGPATPQGAQPQPLPPVDDPTLRFPRPVPIGVSIANADALNIFLPDTLNCYSGTLGCRCVDSLGTEFVLTNLHVGGAVLIGDDGTPDAESPVLITGDPGDRIVQPSTGDMQNFCTVDTANVIATLSDFVPFALWSSAADAVLFPLIMDASVSKAVAGAVGFDPPANGYPAVRRDVLNRPELGTHLQKFGRTSSYTYGTITGLNTATLVNYSDTGGTALAFFTRQISISNVVARNDPVTGAFNPSSFGIPGDSGSLIVARKPGSEIDGQPVALLFAGGGAGFVSITFANPIGPVLKRFGLQVDDGQGAPNQAGISGSLGGAIGPHTTPPLTNTGGPINRGPLNGGNSGTIRKSN